MITGADDDEYVPNVAVDNDDDGDYHYDDDDLDQR